MLTHSITRYNFVFFHNERPALADREPHSQHFPALHRAHCRDVFRIKDYTVFCLLGSNYSRHDFTRLDSGYGVTIFTRFTYVYNGVY